MALLRATSAVMIGRDEEMARLMNALDVVVDDGPAMVLVGGEAGVGKSRLVEALSRRSSFGPTSRW